MNATATDAARATIALLQASVSGELVDRTRVIDGLLDLRLAAGGDPIAEAHIDEALQSVPGRTLVRADWYLDTLGRLADAI